jgi:3-oxoacyl-[acyl-carrier protein] reductase|uniref:SDR family NAD(P)-dependent oxidoreductase n=1 Tax=Algoriphagus sp. TaxID=1872435 RepID=UPI004047B91C
MNIDISNKVVIVTGASKGIGRVIAETFAKEGAKLSLWDIDYEALVVVSEAISNHSDKKMVAIKCDVSSEHDVNEAVKITVEKYGTIDVLIANAGILNASKIMETSVERWDEVFDVNTKGPFLCAKAVAPFLQSKKSGRIIFASSFAAIVPSVGSAAYASSKSALVSLTRVLAAELGPWNITVNAYAPGMIPTNMSSIETLSESRQEELLDTLCIREWGSADDIASLLIFLASEQARYITGTLIDTSGGKFAVQFAKLARS